MKRVGWIVVAAVAVSLTAGAVFAQMGEVVMNAKVPFAFYIGKTELPAGQYEVFRPSDSGFELAIRNTVTGKSIILPVLTTIETSNNDKAEFVFKKVENRSYLLEVLPPNVEGYLVATSETKGHENASIPKSSPNAE